MEQQQMRNILTLAAVAMLATLIPGCSTQAPLATGLHTGKVQGVYVEAYDGVFVERQTAGAAVGKALCAYVTFPNPLPDGQTFVTAQLPAGLDIEAGDLVQVSFADPGAFEADSVPARNKVTALVAKGITQLARSFGAPTQASLQ
jgi:hypothetical protein